MSSNSGAQSASQPTPEVVGEEAPGPFESAAALGIEGSEVPGDPQNRAFDLEEWLRIFAYRLQHGAVLSEIDRRWLALHLNAAAGRIRTQPVSESPGDSGERVVFPTHRIAALFGRDDRDDTRRNLIGRVERDVEDLADKGEHLAAATERMGLELVLRSTNSDPGRRDR